MIFFCGNIFWAGIVVAEGRQPRWIWILGGGLALGEPAETENM
jgi:hypothetical protein